MIVLLYIFLGLGIVLYILVVFVRLTIFIKEPVPSDTSVIQETRKEIALHFYSCSSSWLRKTENGLWEMFLEGNFFELGVINGKLTAELIEEQERIFVSKIHDVIPSQRYLEFLRYFVAIYNRNIDKHIPKELLLEVYGLSLSASDKYDYVGPSFQRILNYHAAHDIGNTLKDMNLVGCTSFALKGNRTEDGNLIIGRNFDFNFGDEFSANKAIAFVRPKSGHSFMTITWGGMIGVVSGMNSAGLTVTINASKSKTPWGTKTPVPILAREILQNASNIKEATEIAGRRQTFISESFLIGSHQDGKAVIIEKSASTMAVFDSGNDQIICANHFQSDIFKNEKLHLENVMKGSSMYRFKRTEELLSKYDKLTVADAVTVLRDRKGLNGADIGLRNEKVLNQLIAHHAIVFKPGNLTVWISTNPYQLGEFVAYDLKKIFSLNRIPSHNEIIHEAHLTVKKDTFLNTDEYQFLCKYKDQYDKITDALIKKKPIQFDEKTIEDFISSNPECFETYSLIGDYLMKNNQAKAAVPYYEKSLEKEVVSLFEEEKIHTKLKKCIAKSR